MTALVLGGLIAAIAVILVALPFLRRSGSDELDTPNELEERRLLLIEERDRALAALKELEFDHRTGKIDDVDYRALVVPLRRAAADALRSLDAYKAPEAPPAPEAHAAEADAPAAEAPAADAPEVDDSEADDSEPGLDPAVPEPEAVAPEPEAAPRAKD